MNRLFMKQKYKVNEDIMFKCLKVCVSVKQTKICNMVKPFENKHVLIMNVYLVLVIDVRPQVYQ